MGKKILGKVKYTLHKTTTPGIAKIRKHTEPYTINFLGKELIIHPGVFSPKYDWTARFHIKHLGTVQGKAVLDLGCGTGAIGLFAALKGAKKVVSADINSAAVKNARANYALHGIKNAEAIRSNLFSAVKGKFDVIVFNLPYHGAAPRDMLERAVTDEGYRTMKRFFKEVGGYLKRGGIVEVGFSTSGDIALLKSEIAKSGFKITKKHSRHAAGYNGQVYVLAQKTR
jgi:release factor glutamine methyltransferase